MLSDVSGTGVSSAQGCNLGILRRYARVGRLTHRSTTTFVGLGVGNG